MSQSIDFALSPPRLQASFDGPQLTSNGGLCWLSEADTALGLCAALAQRIPYTIGLVSNERLESLAPPLTEQAKQQPLCRYRSKRSNNTSRTPLCTRQSAGSLP